MCLLKHYTKSTKLKEGRGRALTTGRSGAGLAGSIPGLADVVGAAAHLPGYVKSQFIPTCAVIMPEADALPHVCSWVGKKSVVRDTQVRGREGQTNQNSFTNPFENYWLDISTPAHLKVTFTF